MLLPSRFAHFRSLFVAVALLLGFASSKCEAQFTEINRVDWGATNQGYVSHPSAISQSFGGGVGLSLTDFGRKQGRFQRSLSLADVQASSSSQFFADVQPMFGTIVFKGGLTANVPQKSEIGYFNQATANYLLGDLVATGRQAGNFDLRVIRSGVREHSDADELVNYTPYFSEEVFGFSSQGQHTIRFAKILSNGRSWAIVPQDDTLSSSSRSTAVMMYTFGDFFPGEREEGDLEDAIFPEEISGGHAVAASIHPGMTFSTPSSLMSDGIEVPLTLLSDRRRFFSAVQAGGYANARDVYVGSGRESGAEKVYDPALGFRFTTDFDDLLEANNRFLSFRVPHAMRNGDDQFELDIEGIRYDLDAGETFDFTTINPEGVATFSLLGIDQAEQIDFNESLPFSIATRFANEGAAEVRIAPYIGPLAGDYDADGDVDIFDLNEFSGNLGVAATGSFAKLDLDDDGQVTLADHDIFVTKLLESSNGVKGARIGDVDLDGMVSVLSDGFRLIGNLGRTGDVFWVNGDLNADQRVDILGDGFRFVSGL